MTDVKKIAEELTQAQRDTMLGHLVEISPDEAQALIDAGLKEKPFEQKEIITRQVWPATKKGLALRDHLKRLPNDQ